MLTVVQTILSAVIGPQWRNTADLSLPAAYTSAPLRTGRGPLALGPQALDALRAAAPGIGFGRWSREDAARALLLIDHHESRSGDAFVRDALECFELGDAGEQQSFLRALAMWPEATAFLPCAIDACRTNIVPLFESLACENPYPSQHFPDRNFNQVVLKAMFNAIELSRIVGLPSRLNPELSRMARDYAAERTAAGRTVPADLDLAIHDSVNDTVSSSAKASEDKKDSR